jgi:hypothetical protein
MRRHGPTGETLAGFGGGGKAPAVGSAGGGSGVEGCTHERMHVRRYGFGLARMKGCMCVCVHAGGCVGRYVDMCLVMGG